MGSSRCSSVKHWSSAVLGVHDPCGALQLRRFHGSVCHSIAQPWLCAVVLEPELRTWDFGYFLEAEPVFCLLPFPFGFAVGNALDTVPAVEWDDGNGPHPLPADPHRHKKEKKKDKDKERSRDERERSTSKKKKSKDKEKDRDRKSESDKDVKVCSKKPWSCSQPCPTSPPPRPTGKC